MERTLANFYLNIKSHANLDEKIKEGKSKSLLDYLYDIKKVGNRPIEDNLLILFKNGEPSNFEIRLIETYHKK